MQSKEGFWFTKIYQWPDLIERPGCLNSFSDPCFYFFHTPLKSSNWHIWLYLRQHSDTSAKFRRVMCVDILYVFGITEMLIWNSWNNLHGSMSKLYLESAGVIHQHSSAQPARHQTRQPRPIRQIVTAIRDNAVNGPTTSLRKCLNPGVNIRGGSKNSFSRFNV